MDPISMVCPPGTGCPFTTGLGLPEILLWVLSFAVIFAVLSKVGVVGKKPAALIAIALGFMVLMAVPASLITVLASMSTSLIVLLVGIIVAFAIFEAIGPRTLQYDAKGEKVVGSMNWLQSHGTAVAIVLLILAAIVFWASGGAGLIGIGALPSLASLGVGTWILILAGVAVLWMVTDSEK